MGGKVTLNTDGLKKLKQKAKELHGERKLPLTELMSPEFMREYTDFSDLQAMLDASGIENAEELKGEKFSQFVAEHTKFGDWGEMQRTAGAEYAKRQLGLK